MDPDLVEIASFGEGFNIGPTLGLNLPITPSIILTATAGYTWRGSFEREGSSVATSGTALPAQIATNIDPGDVFTFTGALGYDLGAWAGKITGSISQETQTLESGLPLYRAGRRYVVTGTWSYTWADIGVTTLTAAAAHSGRNNVLFVGASELGTELMNTNSNMYRVGLQHLFPFGALWIGPLGSFLQRDQNAYDPITLQFVPAKQRWSAGGLARYAAGDNLVFNVKVEYVRTQEDENPAPDNRKFSVLLNDFVAGSAVPVVSSHGWQAAIGGTAKF
jgi:hypothetical protein